MAILRGAAILIVLASAFWAALLLGCVLFIASRTFAYPLVAACDVDGNGVINSADLGLQAQQFGTAGSADVNLDGVVNSIDLGLCAQRFNSWAYPDGPAYDDAIELPTVTTEGLSLEEQLCPECIPSATAPVPTP